MPSERRSIIGFGVLIGAIIAALWISVWFAHLWLPVNTHSDATVQDRIESASALFSALAFATVLYAVWLQRQELALQRKELALTRNELKGQRKQLAAQNTTLRRQAFEGTFFHLVRLHNEIVTSQLILLPGSSRSVNGRQGLAHASQEVLRRASEIPDGLDDRTAREALYGIYREVCHTNTCDLTHYFRNLYHLLRFVDRSDWTAEKKFEYVQIVRAQLTEAEAVLILFNGLRKGGESRFKPLIEMYRLLNILPVSESTVVGRVARFYDLKAFGERSVQSQAQANSA